MLSSVTELLWALRRFSFGAPLPSLVSTYILSQLSLQIHRGPLGVALTLTIVRYATNHTVNSSLSQRSVASIKSKRTSSYVVVFRTLAVVDFFGAPAVQVYYRGQWFIHSMFRKRQNGHRRGDRKCWQRRKSERNDWAKTFKRWKNVYLKEVECSSNVVLGCGVWYVCHLSCSSYGSVYNFTETLCCVVYRFSFFWLPV